MAGFCGFLSGEKDSNWRSGLPSRKELFGSVDLIGMDERKDFEPEGGIFLLSKRVNTPVKGEHFFENDRLLGLFSGDIVGAGAVPWGQIAGAVLEGNFEIFANFKGFFSFAFYLKDKDELLLVSDRLGFLPIFYEISRSGDFTFSTCIGTFAKVNPGRKINKYWIYEYFYFSFPLFDTTIYSEVKRLPHSSVLHYSRVDGKAIIEQYAADFRRNPAPLKGEGALRHAEEVFSSVIPQYFNDADEIAHALTAGYDTRTSLVFCPKERRSDVLTYTYGLKGCDDLEEASKVARMLGFKHREIYFDEEFINSLPALMVETVYLSSLLENINRSYLPFVYRELTHNASRYPVTFSGIGGDALFRGHVPVPNGLSYDMERTFITGKRHIDTGLFKKVFGQDFDEFYQYIDSVLDRLEESYGEFSDPRSFFYYQIYDGLIKYFSGELYIASNYSSLRIPFFDPEIIRLACDIEYSTFKLSRFINGDTYIESLLQARLLSLDPESAKVKIHGLPLRAYTVNNKFIYSIYRLIYRGPDKLKRLLGLTKAVPLERWDDWQKGSMAPKIRDILFSNGLLPKYVEPSFLDVAVNTGNVHWTKLSATMELALRLVSSGWEKF